MNEATFNAALAEYRVGVPKAVASAPAAAPAASSPAVERGGTQDAPASVRPPLKVSGGGVRLEDAPLHNAELMERDPTSGKLRGLELPPDEAQAADDALLDEMRTPPDSPAGYSDPPLPAEFRLTKEAGAEFRNLAHSLGLGNGQCQQALVALTVAAEAGKKGVSLDKYSRAGDAALRKLWGDAYDVNLACARSVAEGLMQRNPHARELLSKTHAGSSPALIRILAEIGERRSRQR
jgi:hypothetical protein